MPDLDRSALADLLRSEDTYATTLATLALMLDGEDIYEMDAIEVFESIKDFSGVELSETNQNKLHAWLVAATTPGFYRDLPVFHAVTRAFSGDDPDDPVDGMISHDLDSVGLLEFWWARYEMRLVFGEEPTFSPEILEHLAGEAGRHAHESGAHIADVVTEFVNQHRAKLQEQLAVLGHDHELPVFSIRLPDQSQ